MSRVVLFLGGRKKLREPRRLADDERQHARRERIERAGMADLHSIGDRPSSIAERRRMHGDDVVRRRSGRLVDDDDAVGKKRSDPMCSVYEVHG